MKIPEKWTPLVPAKAISGQQRIQGGMRPCPPPPWKGRKHFLTRYTDKNGISNLYILLKSALKMQEMPFQRPKFQNISRGHVPGPPYNCVVTMPSHSLKSWLRHCIISHIYLAYLFGDRWHYCLSLQQEGVYRVYFDSMNRLEPISSILIFKGSVSLCFWFLTFVVLGVCVFFSIVWVFLLVLG